MLEKFFLKILLKLPEEFSHSLAIFFLKFNLLPKKKKVTDNLIKVKLFNFDLSNPIGLAAGFDKNAEALPGLINQSFSFLEIGTVTPLPQYGNKKPRVFRYKKKKSVINQLGFPNIGALKVYKNIAKVRKNHNLGTEPIIGVNIGCNKNTSSPIKDYEKCFDIFSSVADYITINISSPNTPGLRTLQLQSKLSPLLKRICHKREIYFKKSKRKVPIALKISPDLNEKDLKNIAALSIKYDLQAIIATNTSVNKELVNNSFLKSKDGGLSGKLLYNHSNKVLANLKIFTKGKIQIIGVGGIDSAESVLKKIELGASAIQLYSSLIYSGISHVKTIILDLINLSKLSSKK